METRVVFLKMKKSLSTSGFEVEKKVALLEKKKCLDAQEKNKQLKTKLKFYSRQYETFQKTLAEFQQKELERVISGDLRVEIATGKQVQMFGCHLFDTMEGRLDARFHELEHAFQVMQQPMTSTDTDIIQTKNEKRGAVEFTRLELLPFENSAISATMWSVIEAGKFPDGEHSIVRRRSGDSVAVSTRVTVQASCGEVVIIDTHSVMKRFVTPQGNAFITEACSDWNVNSPALGAWRHSTREEGCFVVRSYDASPRFIPALETRVTFLKLRRTQMTLMNAGVGLSEEQKRWRDAATREKQSCQASRDENKLLNDKLESCIRTCNDLRTVLSVVDIKQRNLIVANAFAAKTLRTEKRLQLSSTALLSLENRINERHCELEYYFNHIQSTIPGRDVDQVTVHREGVEGTSATLEFKRKRLIPFNADITSREIWNTMHLGVFPADHSLQVSKCSDDTLASQGCETHPLECGGTVDLRVTCLMKRVVIPGGCVMLIESTTEWRARPVQAKAWSHVTTDSGWALVRPNGPRPDTCQLQFAIRLRTEDPDEQNAVTLLTPTVSDVVVHFFSDLLNTRQQLVENALLDSMS
ncbi:Hypothetical protein PHPALM_250 [Phytophthora palmivora]|uniref:Uncharacterized protein n=1 Tax=Phytophthora palmivora TaxID=4796 RepID=A0A2P4YVB0_9STRA|nr:Hypothetical protein PHPALM_250 [Phytophthora palmivora]